MRRMAAVLVAALALAGCGEIPQPFRHEGPPAALTRPKMARGLTIRPTEDRRLAQAVVKALETHEIPAVVRDGPAFGHVVEAVPAEQGGARGLQWRLIPPGEPAQDLRFQPAAAAPAPEAALTAALLARRLDDPDSAPPPGAPPVKRTTLRVAPFRDLPGDGDKALTKATREALERSGFVVAAEGGDYIVEGRVTIVPGLPGEDTVVVSWTVRTGDGQKLATVDQDGVVPRGRLAAPWGSLARDIAEGGAMGVRDVVKAAPKGS